MEIMTNRFFENAFVRISSTTAPEVLNPKIVLWLFLNQFVSDFDSETAGTSKLILIHLDLYENIGHRKMTLPPLPAHPSPGPGTRHSDVTKNSNPNAKDSRNRATSKQISAVFSERRNKGIELIPDGGWGSSYKPLKL